jgi:uncharacterized protein YeaO (DUF488 family)
MTEPVIIYGARMGYRGDDALVITRKDKHPLGVVLAPSDALLWPAIEERRRNNGHVSLETWMVYYEKYMAEMRESYRRNREIWHKILQGTLASDGRRYVTLLCYCWDPLRCHRTIAGMLLAAVSGGHAEFHGDCTQAVKPVFGFVCTR